MQLLLAMKKLRSVTRGRGTCCCLRQMIAHVLAGRDTEATTQGRGQVTALSQNGYGHIYIYMKPARGPQTRFFSQSLLWKSAYTKAWGVIDWGSIKQSLKQILTEIHIAHMHVNTGYWQLGLGA